MSQLGSYADFTFTLERGGVGEEEFLQESHYGE